MLAYALTDIGMKRKVNQDYVWETTRPLGPCPNLFVLADGMGGTKGGDYASRYAAKRLAELVEETGEKSIIRVLRKAIAKINFELYHISMRESELSGMGTTLVVAIILEERLIAANIGDSRLYVIGDGIRQITKDHSYVEEQVALGHMTRNSPEYNSNKHFLTRAIGVEPKVNIDIFESELLPDEFVLLCSDGLTNMLDDDLIFSIISGNGGLSYKASQLIDIANKNGASDNVAVILINPELGGKGYV